MLVAENITMQFAGVKALDNVCLEFKAGQVTAVIGENGAGKSTLMKILSGVYTDYEGQIRFKGQPVQFNSIRDAQRCGISIIHQELALIPYLSIRENIFLGRELTTRWGLLDHAAMRRRTAGLLTELRLDIDPDTLISKLKVGQQQVVEMAKALLVESELIIMDEPTSAISDSEVAVLFRIIDDLRKKGKAIVYISHKLDELFTIADRFLVLRDGRTVDSGEMSAINHDLLIRKMVGRDVLPEREHAAPKSTGTVLSVHGLSLTHATQKQSLQLKQVCFTVGQGEIVGLFGLMGAGRSELLESLFGLHAGRVSGEVQIGGKPVVCKNPEQAIQAGMALVPEDRKQDGLVLELDVQTNISLAALHLIEDNGLLQPEKEMQLAGQYIRELRIKTSSGRQPVKNLSGGNQQKVVLSKWLATKPRLLMLDEPTRGIDVNAKAEIYKLMQQLANDGMAILVVSSEIPELLAIADRILVMCEGTLTANMPVQQATEDALLKAAITGERTGNISSHQTHE